MIDSSQIREHMEVLGSDGQHVGAVDSVEGQRIKLTRSDPAAGGEHHYLHLDMVGTVEGNAVHLVRTASQAMDEWGSDLGDENVRGDTPGSPTAGP
jgi:hypothetical protein